jgi:hypothetical protein
LVVLPPICLCEESRLLVSWYVSDRCDMAGSDEDLGKSRRPSVEDWGWSSTSSILNVWTIERSGDAMCGPHHT